VTRERAAGGFAAVGAFSVLAHLPFLAEPFHIDEPFFLAPVARILKDPRHPLAFTLNWLGRAQNGPDIFNHSIVTSYILAGAWALTRGSEFGMRLACLPFDVVAACALYWLAGRYLKRPLWPVLIVLACPAWFLGMPMLMAEKWVMCAVLLSACALLKSLDGGEPALYWLSAVLLSLAVTLKSTAACLLLPLAAVQWSRGVPRGRLAAYVLACLALPALDAFWLEPWRLRDTLEMTRNVDQSLFAHLQRLRALLVFPAACVPLVAAWPFLRAALSPARRRWTLLGSLLAATVLFCPLFDQPGRPVAFLDRVLGLFFAVATLVALAELTSPRSRSLPGWPLWLSWIIGGLAASWANYFVSARSILLLLPALLLAFAERLERDMAPRALKRFHIAGFGAVFALSLLLARVDADFAGAQRTVARTVKADAIDRGRKVWFTGHWGFQYYMEKAGATALDAGAGGWAEVKPGDLVVVPENNVMQLLPSPPLRVDVVRELSMSDPIPLRLIDVGDRQAGFYASPFGFLPYAVSRAPLDVFTFVQVL
jgi:hypothetical protein